jgi:4-alpha-glucanotransferase
VSALDQLAELAGIEPIVRDFFGNERHVTPAATVALLAAMGIDASSDDAIDAAARRLRARRWTPGLAPAVVVRPGDTAIACNAPADSVDVLWRLTLESGEEFGGAIPWQTCTLVERNEAPALERRLVRIEVEPPLGYHRLLVEAGGNRSETVFIMAPSRAFAPPEHGVWALAAQLYSLRSKRNWGIGDFGDLAALVGIAGSLGASTVALNPLHALYLTNPAAASPYSASSRRFLNALYLDVEAIPDFAESPEAQALVAAPEYRDGLDRLRAEPLVAYADVARLKLNAIHVLWESFMERHLAVNDKRARAFSRFRKSGGDALIGFARYEAIAASLAGDQQKHVPWQTWPEELRDPSNPAVARFARRNPELVAEAMYRQWLCEEQLAAARAAAPAAIGLYLDLAVGIDAGGADVWSDRAAFAQGASVGAPPDELNTRGQDWGLAPFEPHALVDRAFEPFIAIVRSNMQRAGALRMDHVMSLTRLYWIPPGLDATQGAYVRYPFDDLRGIVALESVRNRCVVIGEDLGTVPDGFRETLSASEILGCRLLVFERDGERFRAPGEYTREAVASFATHDLPPFARWWHDADPPTREALIAALREAGVLQATEPDIPGLIGAVHAFLAKTPSAIVAVQLEDVFAETARTNVPGTVDEQPNWRVKRAVDLEGLSDEPAMQHLRAIFLTRDA